uniref:glycosyltransferase family 2 protein n=1 Tax=Salinibacterium sp. TaxID=1915057 RepID=UPI00286B5756
AVIERIPPFVDHIIVIDDMSPDDTYQVALAAADQRTEVIRHAVNKGVGGAIITGHRRALELGADVSVIMAGDDQMDPSYLESLIDPIADRGYGFTKANRFFSMKSFSGMPRHRVFGNMVLTFMTKVSSGYWDLVDPQNGYTAISRASLEAIPLHRVAERYDFENDLLIWLNIANVRALDVPIPAIYGEEVSGMKLHKVVPRLLVTLTGGFWRRIWTKYVLWSFSPIALLMLVGIPLVLLGLVVGIWAIAVSAVDPGTVTTGTWLLSVAPALLGTQLLLQAFMLDIQATPR